MTRRLAAAALLVLAGCGGTGPPAPDPSSVRTVMTTDPTSLTFIGNADKYATYVGKLVSESLVDVDAEGRFVPRVARDWSLSDDGREATFRLREDVLWQDGEPVTAADVVFTADKVRDPATQARSWSSEFLDVASVEAVDPHTVRVRYSRPNADWLDAWRVPLVPAHLAGGDADFLHGEFSRHPIGCGAYSLDAYTPGQSLVLRANPRYFDGKPPIDRLVFRILKDDRTTFEALLSGELDLWVATPDLWKQTESDPRARRLASLLSPRQAVWYVGWNLDGSNPFFADPRVRRALLLALDRETFCRTVARGLGRPAAGTYLPGNPWTDPDVEPLPFDPGEANRLLEEAGWRDADGDGVREKDGRPFAFTVLYPAGPQEIADRIAAWFQHSLAEVGARVELDRLEWQTFQRRRKEGAFEAAMASYMLDLKPDQWEIYHSAPRGASVNYGSFADAEVDRLLETGRSTLDPEARAPVYRALQRRISELQPIGVMFQFEQPVLHDARLAGVVASPFGLFDFQPGPRAWRWETAAR